jgi:hypothetical protein
MDDRAGELGELVALPRRLEVLNTDTRVMALEAVLVLLVELLIARGVVGRDDLAEVLARFEDDTLEDLSDLLQGPDARARRHAQGLATGLRHACKTLRAAL